MNSWSKSDSMNCNHYEGSCGNCHNYKTVCDNNQCSWFPYIIGENDMKLAQKLILAGSEHRKFMRQIMVSVDITAPSYIMAEFDTYKVGITRNSCSFMHKGTSKPFDIEDFEYDDERIAEILSTKKIAKNNMLFYPYETDEYRIYTTSNGRKYEVYRNGRIFSLPFDCTDETGRTRHFERKEVKPSVNRNGYWELNIGGRSGERWLLHRLVGCTWLDNPNNYETIDHLDNDKNNNSVENLEWVSRIENVKREFVDGLQRNKNLRADYLNWKCSSKITPFDKMKIINLHKNGYSKKQIAEDFKVSQSQISVIIRNGKNTSDNAELFEDCWIWEYFLNILNNLRDLYLETKNYKYFRLIREYLPQSYLYRSTVTMNYENLRNMYFQRRNHKLNEWSGKNDPTKENFCKWVETLPYAKELIMYEGE